MAQFMQRDFGRLAARACLAPLAAILCANAAPMIDADPAGPVLMDGKCSDATWQSAKAHALGNETRIRFAADENFLYVCLEPPLNSFANVDIYVQHGGAIHNLHASAQLGERTKSDSAWPDYQWWNQRGWAANWLPYVGRRPDGDRSRPPFGFVDGREFQIERSKFPGSTLQLMVHVHELATPAGMSGEERFPTAANEDAPQTWIALRMTG